MKYLILLLLTPLLIAQTTEEVWADYIKNYAGELTHLACTSTGTETRRLSTQSDDFPRSSTDYYMFNKDHVFARQEIWGYETLGLLGGEDELPLWKVTNNDQTISGFYTADEETLKALSDEESSMKKLTASFVINRLTGVYTKRNDATRFVYKFDADFSGNSTETGKCEVYDPNVKKF